MLKKDLCIDLNNDLMIENGDLKLSDKKQSLKQQIKRALLTFKGEWFLDENIGLPYYQEILGQKNSINAIKAIFVEAIQKIEGVKELVELKIRLDDSRSLFIKFTIIDADNDVIKMEV
jgi:hypothetical protein